MITEQMDIYFVQKDYQTKEYKMHNGNIIAQKIGSIFPPGQYGYQNAPNMKIDFTPAKSGEWIVLPKGVRPGQENMNQGQQNINQGQQNFQQQGQGPNKIQPHTNYDFQGNNNGFPDQ